MKKSAALITALALCLALGACNSANKQSAYELYTLANEKMGEVTALEADTKTEMTMTYGEESMDMTMSGTLQEIIHSETDIELAMLMTTEVMGQSMDVNVYYKDGIYYMDTMGMKYAVELPLATVMEQVNVEAFKFGEDAVKDQSLTSKDGGTEVSFTLAGSTLNDMLSDQLSGLTEQMGTAAAYEYGDVKLTAFITGDGQLTTTNMAFSFDMTIEGMTIPVDAVMYLKYTAFNDDVTLTAPSDLDSYMSVDAGALGL